MNKVRVETISDGVFAIVMTLLIFDIKVPQVTGTISDGELWIMVFALWPLFLSYALSFLVLAVMWINHHFIFHTFAKEVNRQLNLMNMVYLLFIAFVPFSAHLLGSFPYNQPAVIIYGFNIMAVVLIAIGMLSYIRRNKELRHEVSTRLVKQGRIRGALYLFSYAVGILVSFIYIPLSIFLFLFPIIFNIIPGTLDFTERLLGVHIE